MKLTLNGSPGRKLPRGFTLIELLAVIAIIVAEPAAAPISI
jgi:prepilin-type N-terminal cleavage/methylation domain-containing protein